MRQAAMALVQLVPAEPAAGPKVGIAEEASTVGTANRKMNWLRHRTRPPNHVAVSGFWPDLGRSSEIRTKPGQRRDRSGSRPALGV